MGVSATAPPFPFWSGRIGLHLRPSSPIATRNSARVVFRLAEGRFSQSRWVDALQPFRVSTSLLSGFAAMGVRLHL